MWFKLQTHAFNSRFVEELVFPLLSAQIRSDVSLPWEDSMFQMSTPAHIYFLQPQSCWAQPVTRLAVILPVWLKNKGQFLAKPLVRPKTLSDRFDSLAHGACSLKWGGVGGVAVLFLRLVQQRCPTWDIHMMCNTWGQDSYSFSHEQFWESALVQENISEGHSELKIAWITFHPTLVSRYMEK